MKIGIFGGSFDPVHVGHLWIAEAALESLGLDQIRWIPAAQSPLKPSGPIAPAETRVQMLQLALAGAERHVVDDREIQRGKVSYTVDTVAELLDENESNEPATDIYMVIGSDSLRTMQKWRDPKRLLSLVIPAVVQRAGDEVIDFSVLNDLVPQDRIELFRQHIIEMPLIEVSSSELRERVRAGQSVRFRTPRAVEALIEASALYRP